MSIQRISEQQKLSLLDVLTEGQLNALLSVRGTTFETLPTPAEVDASSAWTSTIACFFSLPWTMNSTMSYAPGAKSSGGFATRISWESPGQASIGWNASGHAEIRCGMKLGVDKREEMSLCVGCLIVTGDGNMFFVCFFSAHAAENRMIIVCQTAINFREPPHWSPIQP